MNADIRKYVSRYVVPFYFNYEDSGYKKICEYLKKVDREKNIKSGLPENSWEYNVALGLPKDGQWLKAGFWENYKSVKETQAEMDIYSYLPSIFLEEKNVANLGISFVYKTNGKLLNLGYQYTEERIIEFSCKELGILLLRNGTGFIWYETEFNGKVSIDEYVRFQHDFKELARTHECKIYKKIGFDKEKKQGIYEDVPFCLGKWLSKVVSAGELGIRFWAERITKSENSDKESIPDKALLYQYLFIEQTTDEDRNNLVFRIANGYNDKYNAPEDIDKVLYKPFGNTCFYISKAGMACVVKNADSNEAFFDGQFKEKFVRDYFFIYLLLAYQSYSCAHYSRLLTMLPAKKEVIDKQEDYAKELESLNEEINLFLVKSVFESVSNIHHQNGAYRFGKNELCIEGDIQSLTIGLGALEAIVKDKRKEKEKIERENEKKLEEKRDDNINLALKIFGFMVVVSAWIDGLNLIDWFMAEGRTINLYHIGLSAVILALTLSLIITLVWNRKRK